MIVPLYNEGVGIYDTIVTLLGQNYPAEKLSIIVVDEGWKALDDEVFVARIRDWEKTIRKRNGIVGFALGCAGFRPVVNRIGQPDLFGRKLEMTEIAVADELAAAASFVMGQAAEGIPAVLVRGALLEPGDDGMRALLREPARDLFRA